MLPLRLALLLMFVASLWSREVAAIEQYQAYFRDGKKYAHDELRDLFVPDRVATLGGRSLFDPKNSVRLIRNTRARIQRKGSLIEFANGDILPGQLVTYLPSEPGVPGRFVVTFEQLSFDGIPEPATITVREGQIRRYVSQPTSDAPYVPGRVVTRDGRQWNARSLRFQGGQVQLLMREGVQSAALTEIARLDFTNMDVSQSIALDAIWSQEPSSVARIRMTDGSEITFSRSLAMRSETSGYCLARPSWALDPIRFHLRQLVAISFRDPNELPLALIPTIAEERKHPLSIRPVLRNAGTDGGLLRLGSLTGDTGFAVHAYQSLSFRLPAGAEELTGLLGVSQPLGAGCVKCRLYGESIDSKPLWESDFIRGGDEPAETKISLQGVKELVFVADPAHEGRPAGADPLDIRDDVVWLEPMLRLGAEVIPQPYQHFAYWFPAFQDWVLPEEKAKKYTVRGAWERGRDGCVPALVPNLKSGEADTLELHRTVKITAHNARLIIEAARDSKGKSGHELQVFVDDQKIESTMNGDIKTISASLLKYDRREYNLGQYVGREIKLSINAIPRAKDPNESFGLAVSLLTLRPLIDDVPADGEFLKPDVLLTSLPPTTILVAGQPKELKLVDGKTAAGEPLAIRGLEIPKGFAVPTNTDITYELAPTHKRFVAVLGLASGWQGAGPYSLLLDGEPFWTDTHDDSYGRNSPGVQIDVPIPEGHKTITLRVKGSYSEGAWGMAGFMTKGKP